MTRAELPAIQPAAVVDGPAADDELRALLAGVENLSDDEIEALPEVGMGGGRP